MPYRPILLSVPLLAVCLGACQQQPAPVAVTATAALAPNVQAVTPQTGQPAEATAAPGTNASADVLRLTNTSGTVDCTDKHVEVLDNNARISLTGQCLEVYVIGDDVSLTFQNAASIQVVGARAKVEGTSALQEFRQLGDHGQHRLGAITKELYLQGANNELAVESAAELRVTGDNNRVGWRAGNPSIDDIGNGNRLQPAQ